MAVALVIAIPIVISIIPEKDNMNIIEGDPEINTPTFSNDGLYAEFSGTVTLNNILKEDIKDLEVSIYMQTEDVVTSVYHEKVDLPAERSKEFTISGKISTITLMEHVICDSNGRTGVFLPMSMELGGSYYEIPLIGDTLVGIDIDMDLEIELSETGTVTFDYNNNTMEASITGWDGMVEPTEMTIMLGDKVTAEVSVSGNNVSLKMASSDGHDIISNINEAALNNDGKLIIYNEDGVEISELSESDSKSIVALLEMMVSA